MSKDSYLLRKYGIDNKDKSLMAAQQKHACKICRNTHTKATKYKPSHPILFHVDHDHAVEKIKVIARKISTGLWHAETVATAKYPRLYFYHNAKLKKDAVALVRHDLRRASVRALLCWFCNGLLGKGRDNPEVFTAAGKYLNEFNARFQ
jgi:hypothetical protein